MWTFWSGFTDAANAISTVVGSRVLKPLAAVSLATTGNFVGIFFGEAVARTLGEGIIPPELITSQFVVSIIVGGLAFDVITYIRGIPISETQVLVGALIGGGIAVAGIEAVRIVSTLQRVLVPMAVAPLVAFIVGALIVLAILRTSRKRSTSRVNRVYGRAQIGSSFFFSVSHGANDAMKSAGLMAALVFTQAGATGSFDVPMELRFLAVGTLAAGTFFGGWRIVRTMGFKVTDLQPYQGFAAETGAAGVVLASSQFGFPLSTTQTVSGAIIGVGTVRRFSAVRWRVVREILATWALTIPAAGLFAFISTAILFRL
ncbi:MAG: inorganic phosphate transporter, partial [Thermoplasmata archaeon]